MSGRRRASACPAAPAARPSSARRYSAPPEVFHVRALVFGAHLELRVGARHFLADAIRDGDQLLVRIRVPRSL